MIFNIARTLILLLVLTLSAPAFSKTYIGLGHNLTTVNNLEKKQGVDNYGGLQVFYDWFDLSLGVEANYLSKKQNHKDLIKLQRKYYEMIAWARYNFITLRKFKLYFASGVGGFQEKIKFQVGSDKVSDTSEPHWLLPAALGLGYTFHKNINFGLEFRMIRRMESEFNSLSLRTSLSYLF